MLPNLKALRREKGVSQQTLAEAVGVSQQSVNQYENHNVEPDITLLCRMADYFETSVDYIVGRTAERRPIQPTTPFDLNAEEAEILRRYRQLPEDNRPVALAVLGAMLHPGAAGRSGANRARKKPD